MSEPIYARCVNCRGEFTKTELLSAPACPRCGTHGVPMAPEQDVTLAINWHELRILCIWAENWARQSDQTHAERLRREQGYYDPMVAVIYAIVKPLQEQCPSFTPLTLSGELQDVEEQFGAIETNVALDAPRPPKRS